MRQSVIVQAGLVFGLAIMGCGAALAEEPKPQSDDSQSGPAYILSEIAPSNVEAYRSYLQQVFPLIKRHGGRVVITPFQPKKVIEGSPVKGRLAMIEFPSMAARDAFWNSDEYNAVKHLRVDNATSRIVHIDP